MLTGIVVLARMDSRRLPGKALVPIAGRPLLGHVLDRARRVESPAVVVVATSARELDDPIARFAEVEGAALYRGSADDVAGRCLGCAGDFGFGRFVRLCGDSPFVPPELVDALLELQAATGADVATNVSPRSYPPGASVEVVRVDALRRALEQTRDPEDREHVTRYFYAHPDRFRIENRSAPEDWAAQGLRLAVDDGPDLERARWIAERLAADARRGTLEEVVELARKWDAEHLAVEPAPARGNIGTAE